MTKIITKNEIKTIENGEVVFVATRADILAELRAYRMSNNAKFAKIYEDKIAQMNKATN